MKQPGEYKLSRGAEYLTTLVSVTLLMLIIGVVAMLGIAGHRETQRLKEQIELSVILGDSITDAAGQALADSLRHLTYVRDITYITRDDAMQEWQRQTGENLQVVFGVNPLSPEITVTLKAQYATPAQLKALGAELRRLPQVADIAMPDATMVDDMQRTLRHIIAGFAVLAAVMVVISFVLINNTVHLSIYSRRFSIHTMQLVGATDSFIRRPLMIGNMAVGALAGVIASGLLSLMLASGTNFVPGGLTQWVSWGAAAVVFLSLVCGGALICAAAAAIAACHWLRKEYDKLF